MASYHSNAGQSWQQQPQHESQHAQMIPPSLPPVASPVLSKQSSVLDENQIVLDYQPPRSMPPPDHVEQQNYNYAIPNKMVQWVYNPLDGSVLKDHNGDPLSVDRLLATKPLKHELSTRPGPGNKKLTYISGDDVSRTLNDVFGFDGWDLDIKDVSRVDASKDPKTGKHTIVYTARVRLTHKASGTYKEDCGAGDSTDRVYGTAIAHALKASITDAMKRAARHFGDKLGNSLYSGNFSINKAPVSLRDALDKYDIHRCNTKFGFQKQNATKTNSVDSKMSNASASSIPANRSVIPPPPAFVQNNHTSAPSIHSASATFNMPPPQYYNPHQHRHQNQTSHNTNISVSSNTDRQQQQTHNNYGKNVLPSNILGASKNYQQLQNQSSNSDSLPSNRMVQQPRNQSGVISSKAPSATVRPTSSYGRRPTLGSNNPINAGQNDNGSSHLSSVMSAPTTSGQSTYHDNNDNNNKNHGSRISMEQNNNQPQHQRQPLSANTSHSSSGNTKAHVVSQTPSTYGNNSNSNSYSNAQHKRPPLGAIAHNQTANSFSSESSAKRPKQRHHNPYNQHLGGRKSI